MKRDTITAWTAAILCFWAGTAVGQDQPGGGHDLRPAALLTAKPPLEADSTSSSAPWSSQVFGVVWTDQDAPLPYPILAIRRLEDGAVAGRTIGTEIGEFSFERLMAGSYVIELLDEDGRVRAVGEPLTLLGDGAAGTFLRVSSASVEGATFGQAPADSGARRFGTSDDEFRGLSGAVFQSADDSGVGALGGGNAASFER